MSNPRFSPEFKDEAVRQVTERGYSVAEVSARLASTRRFSSCRTGSRLSMSGNWRLETAPLADEKQREPQTDPNHAGRVPRYFRNGGHPRNEGEGFRDLLGYRSSLPPPRRSRDNRRSAWMDSDRVRVPSQPRGETLLHLRCASTDGCEVHPQTLH